jgi:ABC-type bacteriocin/lantibiotic exporter with double-glycine peptidase domain
MMPYYKQQTPFTCSLACLRMILESIGRKFTEEELAKTIGFNPKVGVSPSMILKVCEIVNVDCQLQFEITLAKLKELLSKNIFPITLLDPRILYGLTEVGHNHFIVIKDISEEKIIINDPDGEYGGENKQIAIQKFLESWKKIYNMLIIIKGEKK